MRRLLLTGLIGTTALALMPAAGARDAPAAATVHAKALVLDGHADVLLPETPRRYYLPGGGSRVDLPHLKAGGVDAVVLSVAVGPGPRDAAGVAAARKEADAKLGLIRKLAADNPAAIGIARSPAEVEALHAQGKLALIIGFQNARSIGSDVAQLDIFYRAGVRVFALNHAGHNEFSDSSRPDKEPVAEHKGLSPLGRAAVKRLNDLGALIDVSQLSTDALHQTLALSRAPVAATHSNARALIDNSRNLSDAELDAIKANGGIVQLTPFSAYLHVATEAERARVSQVRIRFGLPAVYKTAYDDSDRLPPAQREPYLDAASAAAPRATLAEYADHIDYVAKRIGWQHVGIGTDFDHGAGVTGFDSEAEAPNVTAELLKRGYSAGQIDAIWGGNFLRVWRAAQAARAR